MLLGWCDHLRKRAELQEQDDHERPATLSYKSYAEELSKVERAVHDRARSITRAGSGESLMILTSPPEERRVAGAVIRRGLARFPLTGKWRAAFLDPVPFVAVGVPTSMPTALFAALPALRVATRARSRLLRLRRRVAGRCPSCGYDPRATPDRCPECGTPAKASSESAASSAAVGRRPPLGPGHNAPSTGRAAAVRPSRNAPPAGGR